MKNRNSNKKALDRLDTPWRKDTCLLPLEIEIFKKSIRNQIESLTKTELLNLIQIGHIAIDLYPLLTNKFSENDVHILFADFGPTLDHMINKWNLSWVIAFNYFHCHAFPTSNEDIPTENPHWNEIISMDTADLLRLLDDFMHPMFTDSFEVCFLELMNALGR